MVSIIKAALKTKHPIENAKVGVQTDESILFGKKSELSFNDGSNKKEEDEERKAVQEDSIGRLENPEQMIVEEV